MTVSEYPILADRQFGQIFTPDSSKINYSSPWQWLPICPWPWIDEGVETSVGGECVHFVGSGQLSCLPNICILSWVSGSDLLLLWLHLAAPQPALWENSKAFLFQNLALPHLTAQVARLVSARVLIIFTLAQPQLPPAPWSKNTPVGLLIAHGLTLKICLSVGINRT